MMSKPKARSLCGFVLHQQCIHYCTTWSSQPLKVKIKRADVRPVIVGEPETHSYHVNPGLSENTRTMCNGWLGHVIIVVTLYHSGFNLSPWMSASCRMSFSRAPVLECAAHFSKTRIMPLFQYHCDLLIHLSRELDMDPH